jgi:hypothetical protein
VRDELIPRTVPAAAAAVREQHDAARVARHPQIAEQRLSIDWDFNRRPMCFPFSLGHTNSR